MRTQKEIDSEVIALKALQPFGPFKSNTAESIKLMIEELEYGFDDTADEWNELSDDGRDIITQTRMWKEGEIDDKPSEGWGGLAK